MKTLQELLDEFNKTKLGKMKEGKIRQSVVGMSQIKNIVKDDLFELKRRNGVKSSSKLILLFNIIFMISVLLFLEIILL